MAAVLTVIVVLQTRRVIIQGELAQKEASAPDWEVRGQDSGTLLDSGTEVKGGVGHAEIINSGFGSGYRVRVSYQSIEGDEPARILPDAPVRIVVPGETFRVHLQWAAGKTLHGLLTIKSKTRGGYTLIQEFEVRASTSVLGKTFFQVENMFCRDWLS